MHHWPPFLCFRARVLVRFFMNSHTHTHRPDKYESLMKKEFHHSSIRCFSPRVCIKYEHELVDEKHRERERKRLMNKKNIID